MSHLENASERVNACLYQSDNLKPKFFLLSVFAPLICLTGVMGNLCALVVFLQKRMRAGSVQNVLLAAMAVCDFGVLVCFFMIYTVENVSDYFSIFKLYEAWIHYGRELFFLAHLFKACSVYLTVSASVERWLATAWQASGAKFCRPSLTPSYIMIVVFFSFAISSTKYLEIDLIVNNCTGFAKYKYERSKLSMDPIYELVYTVWLSPVLITWLPFMLLLALNVATAYSFYRMDFHRMFGVDYHVVNLMTRVEYLKSDRGRKLRKKRKEATLVLIIIVGAFLVFNTPDFCITLMEHISSNLLRAHADFYSFAKDVVNILAIVQSSINFFIYIAFGSEFRHALVSLICCRTEVETSAVSEIESPDTSHLVNNRARGSSVRLQVRDQDESVLFANGQDADNFAMVYSATPF